jgi:predicted transcriptional regulator
MDALAIILRTVRQVIESSGAPPDALQDCLVEAERQAREGLGGAVHYIRRLPDVTSQDSVKARIFDLSEADLTPGQIAERLGITPQYVRRVVALLRKE